MHLSETRSNAADEPTHGWWNELICPDSWQLHGLSWGGSNARSTKTVTEAGVVVHQRRTVRRSGVFVVTQSEIPEAVNHIRDLHQMERVRVELAHPPKDRPQRHNEGQSATYWSLRDKRYAVEINREVPAGDDFGLPTWTAELDIPLSTADGTQVTSVTITGYLVDEPIDRWRVVPSRPLEEETFQRRVG